MKIVASLQSYFLENKYAVLYNNNGHKQGFKNQILVSNQKPHNAPKINEDYITFLSYDFQTQLKKIKFKKNNLLIFPNKLFVPVEKKIKLNSKLFNSTNFNLTDSFNQKAIKPLISKSEYVTHIKELKQKIQQGTIYEINFCFPFVIENISINPIELYIRLNSISKAPYSALAKFDKHWIISSSPELFLQKHKNNLVTKPIKGTIKRGLQSQQDMILKDNLKNSLKDKTENVMVVDVCRNDFSKIAKQNSVKVSKLFNIESFKQVHQMVSTVRCKIDSNITFTDIIYATFPMPSMTGAPKLQAIEHINESEIINRNAYSGALGYIETNLDFKLNVLIRSVFYNEQKQCLSFSVGSAITIFSNPDEEYEECLLKAKALIDAVLANASN